MQVHMAYIQFFQEQFDISFPLALPGRFVEQKRPKLFTPNSILLKTFELPVWIWLIVSLISASATFAILKLVFRKQVNHFIISYF